jgi:hypothetical protein
MPASPKCAAAKGLAGDNLLCVDFSSVSDQSLDNPPPNMLSGWDFTTNCGGKYWEIAAGKLQVKNFSGFASTCGFTMPAIAAADFNKYNSFTLSVLQTVDVNTTKQAVNVYLGSPVAAQQVWYTTGKFPKTTTTLQIARSALPNGGSNAYQPLFQITSSVGVGGANDGWQIESIAVLGNP